MSDELTITRGFPDALRSEVAVLYDAAFGAKFGIAMPDTAIRLRVLAEAFDPSHCFVALRGGQVLGVAGFQTAQGTLISGIPLKLLIARLGLLGALRALIVLPLFQRGLSPGELLMDGLSVSPLARGGGIGTKLLAQLKGFAAAEGYRAIRLDVINTNEGARRLYERLGFVATTTTHFGYLRWLLGFSAATTLKYDLTQASQPQIGADAPSHDQSR
jgi:ribosomal protein S18 acetylase RimI-like enzyme